MSPRLTKEEKQYQKRQATVGLASNVLGIAAGTAALATASKNKAFKRPITENAGPVTSKMARKLNLSPAAQKRLILAGAGGAVGLQAANLGGDLVTNRVLAREVSKNDQSMISKAEGAVRTNGRGTSLSHVSNAAIGAGTGATVAGAGLIGGGRAMIRHANKMNANSTTKMGHGLAGIVAMDQGVKLAGLGGGVAAAGLGIRAYDKKKNKKSLVDVSKAYRRFDPEADRQRRAGLYTGLGVLGAGLAGREAATKFTTTASSNGKKARGIVAKPGKGKVGLGLAALAATSGAFGANSYKSGLSTRNQPWT